MNRKRLALFLAMLMLLFVGIVACNGNDTPATDTEETEATDTTEAAETTDETDGTEDVSADVANVENYTDANTITISAPELNASYINGFGNSTYDVWVKRLLGIYDSNLRYGTVYYDEAGEFHYNMTTLAQEPEATDNEDGSKTYTFTINEDLLWNDGTPITAKDYLFEILFISHPSWIMTPQNTKL